MTNKKYIPAGIGLIAIAYLMTFTGEEGCTIPGEFRQINEDRFYCHTDGNFYKTSIVKSGDPKKSARGESIVISNSLTFEIRGDGVHKLRNNFINQTHFCSTFSVHDNEIGKKVHLGKEKIHFEKKDKDFCFNVSAGDRIKFGDNSTWIIIGKTNGWWGSFIKSGQPDNNYGSTGWTNLYLTDGVIYVFNITSIPAGKTILNAFMEQEVYLGYTTPPDMFNFTWYTVYMDEWTIDGQYPLMGEQDNEDRDPGEVAYEVRPSITQMDFSSGNVGSYNRTGLWMDGVFQNIDTTAWCFSTWCVFNITVTDAITYAYTNSLENASIWGNVTDQDAGGSSFRAYLHDDSYYGVPKLYIEYEDAGGTTTTTTTSTTTTSTSTTTTTSTTIITTTSTTTTSTSTTTTSTSSSSSSSSSSTTTTTSTTTTSTSTTTTSTSTTTTSTSSSSSTTSTSTTTTSTIAPDLACVWFGELYICNK